MDFILSKVTQQAMNYAIRSGITITSGFALQQCSRLLQTKSGAEKDELENLQRRLESKIRIISPAIDMIELIAARGNTSLESAVSLTKSLRWEIQSLGVRLAKAVGDEELSKHRSRKAKSDAESQLQLKQIIADMKNLLERIEDAVPLINLAITTSGASLSTSLPLSVSPSRLLQASTFLTAGDSQYVMNATRTQIGPTFTLSMYMLFAGHAYRPKDEEGLRSTTWKEVIHKARLKLMRIPLEEVLELPQSPDTQSIRSGSADQIDDNRKRSTIDSFPAGVLANEFAYQLLIIEDLEDDRVHTFEEDEAQPGQFLDVNLAGIRETIPVHEISKIFYADTGKILNIGSDDGVNSPVLLLKRDIHACPPRGMMEQDQVSRHWYENIQHSIEDDGVANNKPQDKTETGSLPHITQEFEEGLQSPKNWGIPSDLDPEWIAFEVYSDVEDSDTELDAFDNDRYPNIKGVSRSSRQTSLSPSIISDLSHLNIFTSSLSSPVAAADEYSVSPTNGRSKSIDCLSATVADIIPPLQTSLSLLDMMIRLMSLQQFEQSSHLAIPDELINFFLQESATTGAAQGDSPERRRIRREARERVGFDPYAESPIKGQGHLRSHHGQNDVVKTGMWRENNEGSENFTPIMKSSSASAISAERPQYSSSSYVKSDISTPLELRSGRVSSPLTVQQASISPSTPLSTTMSRRRILQDGSAEGSSHHSSPLNRSVSAKDLK